MADRMIPVPESLIERVQLAIREGLYPDAPEWAELDHQLALLSQPTLTAHPTVPATDLPELRYSANQHAGRLRARVRELPDSYRRDAALMTEAADQLEYLSRAELDNHHAADMCPYCTPDPTQRRRDQVDVDALVHELFPERRPTPEPPRIEDRAPRTPPCADPNVNRWYCLRGADGMCPLAKCVDPSTISDVTPPTGADR